MDYLEEIIQLTMTYLGLTENGSYVELSHYVRTAIMLCTMQTGQTDFSDDTAKQWVQYTAAQMFADRFGELNNKENSAVSQIIRNLTFCLQQKNRRKAVELENSDDVP